MKGFKRYFITGFVQFLITLCAFAQELPPISNYDVTDYKAGNQNWSITQTENQNIFFANNNGLLEFNGSRWTLYPSPNGSIIRSVQAVGDRIYTGCYMELGYWERNDFGKLNYTSLLGAIEESLDEDEQFWNITVYDEWVLFQSEYRIYLYNTDNKSFKVIDFDVKRAKIFNLGNEIFIQNKEGKLYKIQNGEAILESEDPLFTNNFIVGIYRHLGKKLIVTERGKFYLQENNGYTEWKTGVPGDPNLYLFSTLQLADGGFILGTISSGFIHLSQSGELIRVVDQESGLGNNTVLSLFQDIDQNLWLGMDKGISNINLLSAFTVFSDVKGKLGIVYASLIADDLLYLGTNQGLFYKSFKSDEEFSLINGTKGQVWSLKIIDNQVFCGHNQGTFIVNGDEARLIYGESGTWEINELTNRDELLIQGNYTGLSILEKRNGQWVFRAKIEGFDNSSRSMLLIDQSRVLVNHENKGLFVLKLDPNFKKVIESKNISPMGYNSNIFEVDDNVMYYSNEGVFDLNLESYELSVNEFWTNIFYAQGDEIEGRLIIESEIKKIWGFSKRHIITVSNDMIDGSHQKTKIAVSSDFRSNLGLTGFENVSKYDQQNYIIGTSDGYVLVNLDKLRKSDKSINIDEIQKEVLHAEPELVSLSDELVLSYDENSLKFLFSLPEYDKNKQVEYQYQLSGYLDRWSNWFKEPSLMFRNLPHGSYKLNVRARIGNDMSKNEAIFKFVIEKPWYLTLPAIILYFAAVLAAIWSGHSVTKKYYRRQRNKMMEESQRKLAYSKLQKDQEIMKLKNEQLTMDIESKNRELATTAMSLINKNELLNDLKKTLLDNSSQSSTHEEAIQIINQNLSDNKDWELFKEAFNNADKDFLDKIKKLHPDLTANDLKFCTFLRLNLSSKEIAPLLNISVRSVEIKRYRLRKKLGIAHEMNLVDYILEV